MEKTYLQPLLGLVQGHHLVEQDVAPGHLGIKRLIGLLLPPPHPPTHPLSSSARERSKRPLLNG